MESPRESAAQKYKQTLAQLELGDYQDAMKDLSSVIKKCPSEEAYLKRSECFQAMGNHICALTDAYNALKLNPKSDDAKNRISLCVDFLENTAMDKLTSNDIDGCLKFIDEVLETFKRSDELILIKIRCLIIQNRQTEADVLSESFFDTLSDQNFYEAFKFYYDGRFIESVKMIELLDDGFKFAAVRDVREKVQLIISNMSRLNIAIKDENSEAVINCLRKIIDIDSSNTNIMTVVKSGILLDKFTGDEAIDGILKNVISIPGDNNKPKHSQASKHNSKAGSAFRNGQFELACQLYSKALLVEVNNAKYLTNRSSCYMQLEKFDRALDDALKAIELDRTYWKSYARAIASCLILGDISQAEKCSRELRKFVTNVDSLKFSFLSKLDELKSIASEIDKTHEENNFKECLKLIEEAKKISPRCENFDYLQVDCLIRLERFSEADEMLTKALAMNSNNVAMLFNQGLIEYYLGDLEKSLVILEIVLSRNNDFAPARSYKQLAERMVELHLEGVDDLKRSEFQSSREKFTQAMLVDPTNKIFESEMRHLRGLSSSKLGVLREALEDYNLALRLDEDYIEALTERAKIHFTLREFEDCIIDCDELLKLKSSSDTRKLMKDAQEKLKYSVKRQPHEILGVHVDASRQEIDCEFERLSSLHHRDSQPDATRIEKRKTARRLQYIQKAHLSLTQQRNIEELDNTEDNSSENDFLITDQRRSFFRSLCSILFYLFCCCCSCFRSNGRFTLRRVRVQNRNVYQEIP